MLFTSFSGSLVSRISGAVQAQNVWITYKGKLPGRITDSLKTPPKW
ncbi:DUF1327 domain-containing protein [Escherichia coli]|nr:DUF1327 domain-containing protein [Escherichia coli]MCX3883312.1 DUF1327 domain-containing protein [Escherichia coli]